jgi:uncharacterized protein YfeS
MSTLYIDDREVGISPVTSHPRFVAAASEDFWYSCIDDYSPFGNDTGNDTLRSLEEWLTANGPDANTADFVRNMIYEEWGFDNRTYLTLIDDKSLAGLHEDVGQFLNDVQDKAVIAAALGQLKITGKAGDEIVRLAGYALKRQRALAEAAYADEDNPFRDNAPEYLERLNKMEGLLKRLT